ncbi:hypothetical protein BZZ01_28055 [Nostocales cyanobacterium HT-58-2]|nr:hypothetical protein BZZ01_28055 [Nostocales cyanobacterium HT-58-2]
MLTLKRKNITLGILTVLGLAYFCTLSNLAINPFWRGEITLVSLQFFAIIYVTYLRWSHR